MKNYFTSELLIRLEDYQNNNNQNPSRILLNPLALFFIDRTITRKYRLLVRISLSVRVKEVVVLRVHSGMESLHI